MNVMIRLWLGAACILVSAAATLPQAASAEDARARCDVPLGQWQPRAAVAAALAARRWTVLSIRSDGGCYRIKAETEDGTKIRIRLDPRTLEPIGEKDDED